MTAESELDRERQRFRILLQEDRLKGIERTDLFRMVKTAEFKTMNLPRPVRFQKETLIRRTDPETAGISA